MQTIKPLVRGIYDVQKLRIQMGNRIVANYKARIGQVPGKSEETLDNDAKKALKLIRKHYKLLTDGVIKMPRQAAFVGDVIISSYAELCLVAQYSELAEHEKKHFSLLEKVLCEFPIYNLFLKQVVGVGPAMAGVIISEIDISAAKYPSSLWKYAGLDVAADGRGRSRKREHLEESEYTDSEGEIKHKMGITFNPFLKTKLVGVLGGSFIKAGDNVYSRIYRGYKNRLQSNPAHQDKSKGHINNMAIRYAVKMFLVDLHREWRALEGLPAAIPYQEAKLGHRHAA